MDCRSQRTLLKSVSYSGIGLHTGEQVKIEFVPAPVDTGIVFRRVDFPAKIEIPAKLQYVVDTNRSTTIGVGSIRIHTIEHVMAALKAYQIDNLYVDVSSVEPPVGDGSSSCFIEMIEQVEIIEQDRFVPIIRLEEPVYWSDGEIHNVALPSETYKISYTLNYPECKVLGAQYYSFEVGAQAFKSEIGSCRTFSRYEEVSFLMDKGLIKGGSLENAVIIKDEAVISKGGLVYKDEMVRHKILDIVGDLALTGVDFRAHVIAIRSGHSANFAFAKLLQQSLKRERSSCRIT